MIYEMLQIAETTLLEALTTELVNDLMNWIEKKNKNWKKKNQCNRSEYTRSVKLYQISAVNWILFDALQIWVNLFLIIYFLQMIEMVGMIKQV